MIPVVIPGLIPGLDFLVSELSGIEIVLEISGRLCRSCRYG